jgi:hypothetical protein
MHASIAPMTAATGPAAGVALVRHGVAYGLRLSGCFPARGLWTGVGSAAMRSASLEVVANAELAGWRPARGCESLLRLPLGRGGPVLTLDTHPDKGYLVRADGFGAYLIAPDGQRVLLAPGAVEPWRWQRLLTAQALPVAALLQGLELFHASAVRINGRVLAFTGASGAGKTSLAAQLLLAGATFVSDDVLALEREEKEEEVVIAHPGPALMNLRGSTIGLLDAGERARLGLEVGRDDSGSRLLVRRKAQSSPLHALYLLRRGPRSEGGVRLERLSPPPPSQLLGAGFGTAIKTPARLVRRLDLCAHIARRVPVFALEAPAHATPSALAEAVLRHVLGRAL